MTDHEALVHARRVMRDIDRTLARSRALRCWLTECGQVRP